MLEPEGRLAVLPLDHERSAVLICTGMAARTYRENAGCLMMPINIEPDQHEEGQHRSLIDIVELGVTVFVCAAGRNEINGRPSERSLKKFRHSAGIAAA